MTDYTRGFFTESVRTANPLQTTAIFGVKKGFRGSPVDSGNPFRYYDFSLVRALSGSWIEHLTANGRGTLPHLPVFPVFLAV